MKPLARRVQKIERTWTGRRVWRSLITEDPAAPDALAQIAAAEADGASVILRVIVDPSPPAATRH